MTSRKPSRVLGWWEEQMIDGHYPCHAIFEVNTAKLSQPLFKAAVQATSRKHAMMRVNADPSEKKPRHWYLLDDAEIPVKFVKIGQEIASFSEYYHKEILHSCLSYNSDSVPLWSVYVVVDEKMDKTTIVSMYSHGNGDGTTNHLAAREYLDFYCQFALLHSEAEVAAAVQQVPLAPIPHDVEVYAFGAHDPTSNSDSSVLGDLSTDIQDRAKAIAARRHEVMSRKVPKLPLPENQKVERIPHVNGTEPRNGVQFYRLSGIATKVYEACKSKGLTVGSAIIAALHFSIAKNFAAKQKAQNKKGLEFPFYVHHDLDANLRIRTVPPIPQLTFGCFIGQFMLDVPLENQILFWEYATQLRKSIESQVGEKQEPILYHPAYRFFGGDTEGVDSYCGPDFNLSNIGPYPWNPNYTVATGSNSELKFAITAFHTSGWFCPGGAGYVFLTHSVNDNMCFTWVFVDDEERVNKAEAERIEVDFEFLMKQAAEGKLEELSIKKFLE